METDYDFDLKVTTEVFSDSLTDAPDGYKSEGKVLFYNSAQRKKVFIGMPWRISSLTEEDIADLKGKCWSNQWEEFHPSTNIAHAWKLVEELRTKYSHRTEWCFELHELDGSYDCAFNQNMCVFQDTNPAKAICLAALVTAKYYKSLDK